MMTRRRQEALRQWPWSGKLGDLAAVLLWIAPADGREAKLLTTVEPAKP